MTQIIKRTWALILILLISKEASAQKTTDIVEYYNANLELISQSDNYFAVKKYRIDKKGRIRGKLEIHTSNGVLIESKEYKKGKLLDGERTYYSSKDSIIYTGYEENDIKYGFWTLSNLKGRQIKKVVYDEKGVLIGELGVKDENEPILSFNDQIDRSPSYPGGNKKWAEYQRSVVQTPVNSSDFKSGQCTVKFIIWQDGSISNITIDPSKTTPNFFLTNQLINAIAKGGNWIPAFKDSKPVPYVNQLSMSTKVSKSRTN